MSHNRNPHQGQYGDHLIKSTNSVVAPASPVRFGIIQGTQLPPISSLLESDTAAIPTPTMDVVDASKATNPSQILVRTSEVPAPSKARRPRSPARNSNSKPPNRPPSKRILGPLTRLSQNVSQLQTSSPQNTLNSNQSPNGPQPVGSTINVASNAGDTFHIATMEGTQMVVNIATVTPVSTDNELDLWEPKNPSDDDSYCLPFPERKGRNRCTYRHLKETVLGKRSNQFVEREAKKGKFSEESNLATSLDALAREHARSSISSCTISIPNSASTGNASRSAGDVHGRECKVSQLSDSRDCYGKVKRSHGCKPNNIEQKNDATLELESKNTAEPGNELDFLASVILSQNNPPQGKCHKLCSESQEVLAATRPVPNDSVHSLALAQNPQGHNEGDDEPRSEASFMIDDEISRPVLTEVIQALGHGSPVIAIIDKSATNMENSVSNQTHVTVSPRRASEFSPNAQAPSPRISVLPQTSTKVSNFGREIAKGGIGYKLKRGPKSKKQKQDGAIHSRKVRGGEETLQNRGIRGAASSSALLDPSLTAMVDSSKRCHNTGENKHEIQPYQKPFQCSRSVCSGPSSKASTTSTERISLSGIAPNQKGSRKKLAQSKRTAREGKITLDHEKVSAAENKFHENENDSHHRGKPLPDKSDPSSALAVRAAVFYSEALRVDHPGVEQEENRLAHIRKKAPFCTNAAADAAVTASPALPLEVLIAAAKQSPPYVHKCEQCGSVFNRRFNLNKHIRNVHENIRKFPCITCGELFLQKSHLAAHTLAVHDKSRPFQCDLCPKSFSWIGVLRKHMQAIHKVTLQRKTFKNETSTILKGMTGGKAAIDQIHPHENDVGTASVSSAPKNLITAPATDVVVNPQKSTSISVKSQRNPKAH